jgi:hypothetical protein
LDNEGKHGYIAFYKGRREEIYATSILEAQQLAAAKFKVKPAQSYKVTVGLAELWNDATQQREQVIIRADF